MLNKRTFSPRRFLITVLVLFITALIWNGIYHTFVIGELNATVMSLRRPDFRAYLPLSLLATFGLTCLFTWGYGEFSKTGTIREGIRYGLFFALLAGILVDLNQYVLYPLPPMVATAWFAGGLIEFTLYGILVSKLCRVGMNR